MKPSEHKTVQARILEYAEAIGCTVVSREAAEQRRGFDPGVPPKDRAKGRSLLKELQTNENRKVEQAAKGFDGLPYFVYRTLLDEHIGNAEEVSR